MFFGDTTTERYIFRIKNQVGLAVYLPKFCIIGWFSPNSCKL